MKRVMVVKEHTETVNYFQTLCSGRVFNSPYEICRHEVLYEAVASEPACWDEIVSPRALRRSINIAEMTAMADIALGCNEYRLMRHADLTAWVISDKNIANIINYDLIPSVFRRGL